MQGAIQFYMPDAPYGWLCALSPHPVLLDGIMWPTAEHAYQAQKFAGHPAIQKEISETPDPLAAKAIAAREKHLRPADWHPEKSQEAFRRANTAKFAQHADLAALLLATGDAELIEASPNDDVWGIGPDGTGQNWCGKILMRIRDGLRDGFFGATKATGG